MELHFILAEVGGICTDPHIIERFVIMSLIGMAGLLGLTTGTLGVVSLTGTVIHMATAGASFASIFSLISGDTITILGGTEILGAIVAAIMLIVHC
ncbi:MAG: hypothetical protein Tsb0014_47880 [Pleurocapsa sp.]